MSTEELADIKERILALCNAFRQRVLEHSHTVEADVFEVVIATFLLSMSLAKELEMDEAKFAEFTADLITSHFKGLKVTPHSKNPNMS